MKRPICTLLAPALCLLFVPLAELRAEEGDNVQLTGNQKVLALRGVLQRIAVGKAEAGGVKSTIYRDVEYPISRKLRDPADETDFQVWATLGPKYHVPPLPGTTPFFRGRRDVREKVKYVGVIKFRGAEEFEVELLLDYSGERVRVTGSFLDVENGPIDIEPTDEPHADFKIAWLHPIAGGFATNQNLSFPPDTIDIWLSSKNPLRAAFADNKELSAEDRKLTKEPTVFVKLKKKTARDE